jgi:hypothetical protein
LFRGGGCPPFAGRKVLADAVEFGNFGVRPRDPGKIAVDLPRLGVDLGDVDLAVASGDFVNFAIVLADEFLGAARVGEGAQRLFALIRGVEFLAYLFLRFLMYPALLAPMTFFCIFEIVIFLCGILNLAVATAILRKVRPFLARLFDVTRFDWRMFYRLFLNRVVIFLTITFDILLCGFRRLSLACSTFFTASSSALYRALILSASKRAASSIEVTLSASSFASNLRARSWNFESPRVASPYLFSRPLNCRFTLFSSFASDCDNVPAVFLVLSTSCRFLRRHISS